MKSKIFLVFVLFLFPFLRISANKVCSPIGYSVFTVNGIFTDEVGARKNKSALESKLPFSFNFQPLTIDFLYNPTHLAGAMDLVDVMAQAVIDKNDDYDMDEILNDASKKVKTKKVLLVGHSQGTFYTNNLYDSVTSKKVGVSPKSIGVYNVATPADRVAGEGKYLTSDTDTVINSTKLKILIAPLAPNIHIPLKSGDDPKGHSFSDVYLKYQASRIVSDVKLMLSLLKNDEGRNTDTPCIPPLELTLMHKAQGAAFAVADPMAVYTKAGLVNLYNTSSYIADASFNLGSKIGSIIHNSALAIGNAFSGLFANVAASLPEDTSTLTTLTPDTLNNDNNQNNADNPGPVTEPVVEEIIQETETNTDAQNIVESNSENIAETKLDETKKSEISTEGSKQNESEQKEAEETVLDTPNITQEEASKIVSEEKIEYPNLLPGTGGKAAGKEPPPPDPVLLLITAFTTPTSTNTVIDENAKTIEMTVPFGTDVRSLAPNITYIAQTINPGNSVAADFSSPVVYTLTSADSSTKTYAVTVVVSPDPNPPPASTSDYLDTPGNLSGGGVLHFNPEYSGRSYGRVWYKGHYPDTSNVVVPNNYPMDSIVMQTLGCGQICTSEWMNKTPTYYWVGIYIDGITENLVHYAEIYDTAVGLDAVRFNITGQANVVTQTCADGIKNQDETDIDIGGICARKAISKFTIINLTPNVEGTVDEVSHTISVTVPFGTDTTSMVPVIIHNANSIAPASAQSVDLSRPFTYKLTARDGSTQDYVVTVTVAPPPPPDTTPPSVTSYTFNSVAGDITIDPTVNPLAIAIAASENVNWMSIKLENQADPTIYKIFQSGSGCVDGTNTCSKTWDGTLSGGSPAPAGTYKIKLHMKDAANNEFYDYLTPYVINVSMAI